MPDRAVTPVGIVDSFYNSAHAMPKPKHARVPSPDEFKITRDGDREWRVTEVSPEFAGVIFQHIGSEVAAVLQTAQAIRQA